MFRRLRPSHQAALAATMSGGTKQAEFCSSWKTIEAKRVPPTENDGGIPVTDPARNSTDDWWSQFFGPSACYSLIAFGAACRVDVHRRFRQQQRLPERRLPMGRLGGRQLGREQRGRQHPRPEQH
ncbi:MAG: hypothetical protein ACLPUO_29120 [Streptosporangiaceae bacterium]